MPKAPKTTNTSKVNKSAWIRDQPATASAKEVVAKAKEEGIKLSIAQVYTARSSAKKAKRKGSAARNGAGRPKTAAGSGDEMTFRRLVMSIGVSKAEAYLSNLKRSVGL